MGNDQGTSLFKAPAEEDELAHKVLLRQALAEGSSMVLLNALRDVEEDWKKREFQKMESVFNAHGKGNPAHVELVNVVVGYLSTPIFPSADMAARVLAVNPDDLPKAKLMKEYRSPLQWALDMDHVQLANTIRQRLDKEEKRKQVMQNDKIDESTEGSAEVAVDRSALAKQRLQAAKAKSAESSAPVSARPVVSSSNMMSEEELRQLAAIQKKYAK